MGTGCGFCGTCLVGILSGSNAGESDPKLSEPPLSDSIMYESLYESGRCIREDYLYSMVML